MISPALFRGRGFAPSVVLNLASAFGIMGSAYFTTQYLQSVLDKSALEAALWALLPSVPIGAAAPLATLLVQKGVHRAHVVTGGFLIAASGFALLSFAGTDALWLVLTACAVLAVGAVVVMSQIMDLAMGAAPVERAGSASSLMETGAEFGGALGMALLGSIGTAVYRHEIPDSAPAAAHETLGGALAVADRVPGLATAAREAFTSGMQGAAVAGAVVLTGRHAKRRTSRGTSARPACEQRWRQARFTARADVAPISSATSASTPAGTVSSTVSTASASPPATARDTCMPAMLMPASPKTRPTVPTTPGRSS
jgi:DHA2 family multidrug resistance protein-like MFS transporter